MSLDAVRLNRETSGVQRASGFPAGLLDGGICVCLGMRAHPARLAWAASTATNRRTRENFHRGRNVHLGAGVLSPADRGLRSGTVAGLFGRGLAAPRRAPARAGASRIPNLALAVGQVARFFFRVADAGVQSPDQSAWALAMASVTSDRTVCDSPEHNPYFGALCRIFPDALPVAAFQDRLTGLQLPDCSARVRHAIDGLPLQGIFSAGFDRGDLGLR